MTKPLLAFLITGCLTSCTFTTQNTGQLFVNQRLLESQIQSVQPASDISMTVQTTNGHDSVLIVKLDVDPKIPDDSLSAYRAKLVLSSFITSLPDLNTFTSCKIIFIRKTGSVVSMSKSTAFICPITRQVLTNLVNFKDSTRASVGYIDSGWTYINKDLNLSLPLKKDWYYLSEEHDSAVYYAIGSDVNELPQYRTDTDRKVSFKTLYDLDPGEAHHLLGMSKYGTNLAISGPTIFMALVINRFNSEDEYLKVVNEILTSKKLPEKEIHSYHFGNADFRGLQSSVPGQNKKPALHITAIKQFRNVSLLLGVNYTNEQELEEIKEALSSLTIE